MESVRRWLPAKVGRGSGKPSERALPRLLIAWVTLVLACYAAWQWLRREPRPTPADQQDAR